MKRNIIPKYSAEVTAQAGSVINSGKKTKLFLFFAEYDPQKASSDRPDTNKIKHLKGLQPKTAALC